MTGRVVVIGVGNPFRRDDGAGLAVIRALRADPPRHALLAESDGEPGRMLDLWDRSDSVVVADAVHAHPGCPGRLHTLSAQRTTEFAKRPASSHALGLGETFALASALDRMPREVTVHAVEGADFGLGRGLSAPVAAALPGLIARVLESIGRTYDSLAGAADSPGSPR
ncbi:hydrogenase maturation protease [Streptomyces ardesiacus]|uniref:hydrogenase maturation protease n=1 Tax=Streptomyces ardesiacus TaxID=285564 RepID=UPI0038137516